MNGIDVSGYQKPSVDWLAVRSAGFKYAIVKVSEGATHLSPTRKEHAEGAKDAGLLLSYYHFAHPNNRDDWLEEAEFFLAQLEELPDPDLFVWLDLEKGGPLDDEDLTLWALAWLEMVEDKVGGVGIYCNRHYARKMKPGSGIERFPLWLAHPESGKPPANCPWTLATLWQHDTKGRVPGIEGNVDLNVAPRGLDSIRLKQEPPKADLIAVAVKLEELARDLLAQAAKLRGIDG